MGRGKKRFWQKRQDPASRFRRHRRAILESLEPRLLLSTGPLVISEFMAKYSATNPNALVDDYGDKSDWIEIRNISATQVDLVGYCLTDNSNNLTQCRFTVGSFPTGESRYIAPGEYKLVFASGKAPGSSVWFDTTHGASAEMHLNFKLSDDPPEYLGLIEPNGTTVDDEFTPTYPKQVADISYGWTTDGWTTGQAKRGYFFEPSPGTANGNDVSASSAPIIIDEIMYNTARGDPGTIGYTPENAGKDYIELYNRATTTTSLADYQLDNWWFATEPVKTASQVTSSGLTATVHLTGHGYALGDSVLVTGAPQSPTQSPYNGVFTITRRDADTFDYTLLSTASTPAGGVITVQKGPRPVTSITSEDFLATVTMPTHGFANGDSILISGADQAPYNGVFTIANVTPNTFTYTLPDLPTAAATGMVLAQRATQGMPDVSIAGHGYLVIAADVKTFRETYPTVANVVAGWTPKLSNSGEQITLRDAAGEQVDQVAYANQGDWAQRTRGEKLVTGISVNGTTVTLTVPYHGYTIATPSYTYNGDTPDYWYRIVGVDQAEYNGEFKITAVTRDTITYSLASTPSGPPTGTRILIQKRDANHYGWEWYTAADGGGKSLELINSAMSNNCGENWGASTVDGGTPGAANSIAVADIAPLITDVTHFPIIPHSADTVYVTAHIADELPTGISARVYYRNDGVTDFSSYLAMADDGLHGDGAKGDGVWGATLVAPADGTVVEFYVWASDAGGHIRTWPAAPGLNGVAPAVIYSGHTANLLFQVDDTYNPTVAWTPGAQPVYRLIMTAAERNELVNVIGCTNPDRWSDAAMNGTFITVDGSGIDLVYQASFRNRGHGTRLPIYGGHANNYKIEIPTDHTWKGYSSTIINYANSPSQVLGAALWEAAGMGVPEQQPIQVRVNGVNLALTDVHMYGTYASKEHYDGDFTARAFPDDPKGDMYIIHYTDYPYATAASPGGNLAYLGTNPNSYRENYFKQTNSKEDDFSDLIHLTQVLNDGTISDANFLQAVSQGIDVNEWLRYIAVDSLLGDQEGGLCTGVGDDYGMYRGIIDTRFKLVQWDMDPLTTVWGGFATDRSIFGGYSSIPGLSRLLSNSDTVGIYYAQMLDLINTVFAPQNFNPLVDQILGAWVPQATRDQVKSFMTARIANVLTQIPQSALTITSGLSVQNGYPHTTATTTSLTGTANAAETRSVTVNGQVATWNGTTGAWSLTAGGGTGVSDWLINTGNDWKYYAAQGFTVTGYQATIAVTNLAAAESVISNPANRSGSWSLNTQDTRPPVINFINSGPEGHFASTNQFPGQSGAVTNYVIQATYRVFIPTTGYYTFGVSSDDGFSLSLSNGTNTYSMQYDGTRTVGDTVQAFNIAQAGTYNLRLVYFQNTGGGEVELFAVAGQKAAYDSTFNLVGDIVGGGLNDGDQGTVWRDPAFNDSSWLHGPSQLGYSPDEHDEATVTTYIDNDPNLAGVQKNATTYFRHTFQVGDTSQYNGLILHLMRDDGAVAYLNGTELPRTNMNMPSGTVTSTTWASTNVGGSDESKFFDCPIDVSLLHAGTNVLAVEIHQSNNGSTDVSFDVRLEATRPSGTATGVTLNPGINRVVVQALDGPNGTGHKLKEGTIDIWCDPTTPLSTPLPAPSDPPGLAANPHINLVVRDSYLPGTPILVRAELADEQQRVDRDLWNGSFTLSVSNPAITLSTYVVPFYNGLGSSLVTVTGSGTFTLTATWTDSSRGLTRTATKTLTSLQGQSMTTLSGTLSGASLTWSGIIHVTADVTVPIGSTLTINADTLVLIDGVARGGTTGADIQVLGSIQSLGTAAQPVTITAYNPTLYWGEIHLSSAASSLLQYTEITRAGSSPGLGHPGTGSVGPAIHPENSSITLDHCSVTDIGGKIMYASGGSTITAYNNLWARSVMGPEITGTGLLFQNSFIEEMRWNDDADGIYLWNSGGRPITLRGGVIAGTDDDGIDQMASTILVDDMIIRDTHDKGISQYDGTVNLTRSLIVDTSRQPEDGSQAALSVKTTDGTTATMNIDRTTVYNDNPTGMGIQSRNKYGVASGTIIYNVTNSIIRAYQAVAYDSPYLPSDIHISYSDLNMAWTYGGSHDNTTADPQWVNVAGSDFGNPSATVYRDFRLQGTSPCIDTGDPAGLPDADGSRADMGARPYASGYYAPRTIAAGHITENTLLYPAAGPYHVTGNVILDAGATMTILPGTTVFFDAGTSLTVNGRLVADGTQSQLIRFTSTPGAAAWSGIQFASTMADNQISWAVLEYAATDNGMIGLSNSNLTVDHCTLAHTTDRRRIRTQNSSLIVRNSTFTDIFGSSETPTADDRSEQIWGTNAPAGGQLVIDGNTFGTTKGRNDIIHLTAGSRANGDPVPQILNNTFLGGGDEALDLDGDVYVEGNVFSHFHKDSYNSDPTGSNAISAGDSAGAGHEYFVGRNVFYDVDHAVLVKDNSLLTFVNDTVSTASLAAVYFNVPGYTVGPGRGANVDGVIFASSAVLFDQVLPATILTINRSIVTSAWLSRGVGNTTEDPRLANPAGGNFTLLPGSPALGTGPNGLDMGAKVPGGASITGEPAALTPQTTATLTIAGPGITSYKYRLNSGSWSAETPVATPVQLTGLSSGTYTVYVVGKNVAGAWQDTAAATASKTWTVNTSLRHVRINEVLARNVAAVAHEGTFPDMIELMNDGAVPVSLAGMSISDDPTNPTKFIFPATGTLLSPGSYLILYADNETTSGLHLGFALNAGGDGVFLYDTVANGQTLLDAVQFGPQVVDLSIGRVGQSGQWVLTQPTFGAANVAQRTGNPATLKINEWFANGQVRLKDDFVELYNPDVLPVPLAGLFLTDNTVNQPGKQQIAPLSFVGGHAAVAFQADGNPENGPDHVNFKLAAYEQWLGLYDAGLGLLDRILYFSQTTDVSQGRSPDGAAYPYQFFTMPTPGVSNAAVAAYTALLGALRITEVMYNPRTDGDLEFIELQNTSSTTTLNLAGVRLGGGVDFTFPAMLLAPNQYVVVARDAGKFSERYGPGINLAGQYDGNLSDGGDSVVLQLPAPYEAAILRFNYQDIWYPTTDGGGYALVIKSPGGLPASWDLSTSWQAGTVLDGSPGRADTGTITPTVVINEVLTHTDDPLVDYIELYNTTGSTITIGGWYLSDSGNMFKKFEIPAGTTIADHGYLTYYQAHWENHVMEFDPVTEFGGTGPEDFALNSYLGDDVWLVAADSSHNVTQVVDHVEFGPAVNGEAFGRWSTDPANRWKGNLYPLLSRTPNDANDKNGNGPRVGPVVISEVMYYPQNMPNDNDMEFVEIYNPTSSSVDLTHWHLDKGIHFDFAAGTVLGPHRTLVIVSFDPTDPAKQGKLATFRSTYGIGPAVAIVGGFSGELSDLGEKVQLQRPDSPPLEDPTLYPPLLEDEVVYSSTWGAGGSGQSLRRVGTGLWGDDPASWTAATPSPGLLNPTQPAVIGQYVFYNKSAFDGNTAGADPLDDNAIATDKQALFAGGKATFRNYTSYSRGINGIMVDIANPSGTPTAVDFEFRVGNNNQPGTWPLLATAPKSVATRSMGGGVTRVTLIWDDNVIQNQWLQVEVKKDNLGLAADEVFYFGNAIAESGNDPGSAVVDLQDDLAARAHKTAFTPAPITNPYDFNRDRRVNATDELVARYNHSGTPLQLIDLVGAGQGFAPAVVGALVTPVPAFQIGSALPTSVGIVVSPVASAGATSSQAVPTIAVPTAKPAAHDAVLAAGQKSGGAEAWSSAWAWLAEFEQAPAKKPSSKKDRGNAEAVDIVLAAY